MQFNKKTSIGSTSIFIKPLIKIGLFILVILILVLLVDRINFPSPNKKIEEIIPNEKFKIIK